MDIMGLGASTKNQALAGMEKAARLGLAREQAGDQLEAQKKSTKMNMAGSGMAAGAMGAVALASGPVGWGALAAGALIGGAAGFFGADLF
jgi:hypothetical protein